jgi:hypothetical protein
MVILNKQPTNNLITTANINTKNKLPITTGTSNEKLSGSSTSIENFEFIKNLTFIDDPPLNPDPRNIYK